MKENWLHEKERAQDIILGSLGFGEDVGLQSITATENGFTGVALFSDGTTTAIENEDALSDLEKWALDILLAEKANVKKA